MPKRSRRWLAEHRNDSFVRQSKEQGFRSRAAFKLVEIDDRDGVFRSGDVVLDLGAAPGGWSQVACERVGPRGRVVALDKEPMAPIPGVEFVAGDFLDAAVLDRLLNVLGGREPRVVISDMAPNLSGMNAMDQPRALWLAECVLDLCRRVLAPGGDLLVKVFQGEGFDDFVASVRHSFAKLYVRKPSASRGRSREVYLLARSYRGGRVGA